MVECRSSEVRHGGSRREREEAGEEMNDNEKLVLKRLYDALKQVVGAQCPVPTVCQFCGVREICAKSGKLFREVEKKLKECGEIT